MGDFFDDAVNNVFYERASAFARDCLISSRIKKPEETHVVCYPEVSEDDVRNYSELGIPKSNITSIEGRKGEIDLLSIARAEPIDGNIPDWIMEKIAGEHALSDTAAVATHFRASEKVNPYIIPAMVTACITNGMNYCNINPVFARNPQANEEAQKAMQSDVKIEEKDSTFLYYLIKFICQNAKEPRPGNLEEFHASQKGFYMHYTLLKNYLTEKGFPKEMADLAVFYEGKSHLATRHWPYRYKSESGQEMLVDLLLFDRFRPKLEKYKDIFDRIYNGLGEACFENEEKRQIFFRDLINSYISITGTAIRIWNMEYARKQLQPVKEDKTDAIASTRKEFDDFIGEIRKKGVLFYDPDLKRLYKNRDRLGLKTSETNDCNTVKDKNEFRRGIKHYMEQKDFGLFIVQGDAEDADAVDALETISLNSNGNAPYIAIIGNSLEERIKESIELLKEMGIGVNVLFLNSGNGHINERTRIQDILRKFA
jgi:hypothetical protein